ncbi:MAG: cytochrome b [Alphaproteobacteria bacterium]|nr:cytochrome b [Alphaproteobacteria bacterium]
MNAGPRDRYGRWAIVLHWISAALIVIMFVLGQAMEDADAATRLQVLRIHAPLGIVVLVLTLVRLWRRQREPLPEDLAGPRWQQRLARIVHVGFYVVLLGLTSSGIATIALAGGPAVLMGADGPLARFDSPAAAAHGVFVRLIVLLFLLHVVAALYHQFVRRDHILARMGIGR